MDTRIQVKPLTDPVGAYTQAILSSIQTFRIFLAGFTTFPDVYMHFKKAFSIIPICTFQFVHMAAFLTFYPEFSDVLPFSKNFPIASLDTLHLDAAPRCEFP